MNVLVFTSLYPNNIQPQLCVFIKERVTAYSRHCQAQVRVVAPIPYFPPLKINHWWAYSQVASEEVIEGLAVYHPRYFMIPKVGMALQGLLMFLAVWFYIGRLQKDFDFDLIDAHYVYPDGFAAVLLGKFLGKPVVVSARGSDINTFSQFPVIRRLILFTLKRSKQVIAVSQALKDRIIEIGISGEKVKVISNGVDLKKFFPVPRKVARLRLGLREMTTLVSVGHLHLNKGFDLLIRALHILKEDPSFRQTHLVIVGSGNRRAWDTRKDLEELVRTLGMGDVVSFVGSISHHELRYWYSASNLFCLASAQEGCPNVVLEAMACGIPVVATAVGGIPEIISSDRLGLLATGREAGEMAELFRKALNRPWNDVAIIEHAARRSWECAAHSVHQVFQAALMTHDTAEASEEPLF